MRIIGYAYNAGIHCPDCAYNASAVGADGLHRIPPLQLGADEHGLAFDLRDSDGSAVHPVFSTDENASEEYCGDCHARLMPDDPPAPDYAGTVRHWTENH